MVMLRELNPKPAQLREKLVENRELIPVFIKLLEDLVECELQTLNDKKAIARSETPSAYMTYFIQDLDRQLQEYHTLQEVLEQYSG